MRFPCATGLDGDGTIGGEAPIIEAESTTMRRAFEWFSGVRKAPSIVWIEIGEERSVPHQRCRQGG